ncbi:hypothetical protein BDY19DRAFT_991689 [Irpex rosettiformis]|uniref:Uncharacterized protein n=1 Tax=Irpex rosettiformis TaxID=378272 RepID=A0ACB8UA21_9APHY|nr:hypothetical protein BDY19DRAFT_991689 [Irpex rosettiformis]
MLSSLIPLTTILLTNWGRLLVQLLAVFGAVPLLCSTQARRLAETVLPRTAYMLFITPPANFPALFTNLQTTYITLRKQCIAEHTLLENMVDFEFVAGQLGDAISKRNQFVEALRMTKLLDDISGKYYQLRKALEGYHSVVDLRYCQMMYHGDGALLRLRALIGLPEVAVWVDGEESPETGRILDRTFKSMLKKHRDSMAAILQHRNRCWNIFHDINKDLAALQCLVTEKNPSLHRKYNVDILANLWESLEMFTELANDEYTTTPDLSIIISERERMSAHLLAGKSILDEANSCIDRLWQEKLATGIFYENQLDSITQGVKVMRDARDGVAIAEFPLAQAAGPDILMSLPTVDHPMAFAGRDMPVVDYSLTRTPSPRASPLRRHYTMM